MNKVHYFNVDLATELGIEEAIILQNLAFWIDKNKVNDKNKHDGKYWTYNSAKAFRKLFPYMSKYKINKVLNDLEDDGYIISGNYNKTKFDRTKWYTTTDKFHHFGKSKIESQKIESGNDKNQRPIPYNKPDNKPDNTSQKSADKIDDLENSEFARKCTLYLAENVKKSNKYSRVPDDYKENLDELYNWADSFDKMVRLDEIKKYDIKKTLKFAVEDEFWSKNIRSGGKFRKQFKKQLFVKAKKAGYIKSRANVRQKDKKKTKTKNKYKTVTT